MSVSLELFFLALVDVWLYWYTIIVLSVSRNCINELFTKFNAPATVDPSQV